MSFKVIGWASDYRGPMVRKIVLLALADIHNQETRRCDPSFDYLARWCGCSRRHVIRTVEALESEGVIEITHRHKRSNRYRFNLKVELGGDCETPPGEEGAEVDSESEMDSESGGGDCGAQTGDSLSKSGDRESPKPGKNQEEPGNEPTTFPGPPDVEPENRLGRKVDYGVIQRSWNTLAAHYGFPAISEKTGLGEGRRKKLRTRFADENFVWADICEKIKSSRMVHGQDWFPIDFIIENDTNFRALLEGKYDKPFGGKGGGATAGGQPGKTEQAVDDLGDFARGN